MKGGKALLFTGIVEEVGKIKEIRYGSQLCKIEIECNKILEDIKIGDSISTNGLCLTAAEINSSYFTADIMPESIRRSTFKYSKIGDGVNLERAMPANGRFGGHIVTGHIDGTGKIINIENENNAVWLYINADNDIIDLIVEKGSVAIDGISLTIAKLENAFFAVSIIPHTAQETVLLNKKSGDFVNIENDIIGKYIKKFVKLPEDNKSSIDVDFLIQNGFY